MNDATALLIDNSNTRTKLMLARRGALISEQRLMPTASIAPEPLEELLSDWRYQHVLISSVVPDKQRILAAYFGDHAHCLSSNSPLSFDIAPYAGQHTIGADRLANAAGLLSYGRLPAIAVDLGTAVTYEVLCEGGKGAYFAGGVIAPGLSALARALNESTAQLPLVDARIDAPVLAQDTVSALRAGVHYGYMGMIRETLARLSHEWDTAPLVVLTGGDAARVHSYDANLGVLDDRLTMKGLASISMSL